ncbi:hypothetical protein FB473_000856 [Brooklawnia cerclae]|uniref:PKD domain-containing protein n=1 Tax=Brooklawnia cerclae TaxID=349934 RepID=A0ABX0SHH3_9ACTN|nr:hypothetical protein [Brooklawnia cerclae]
MTVTAGTTSEVGGAPAANDTGWTTHTGDATNTGWQAPTDPTTPTRTTPCNTTDLATAPRIGLWTLCRPATTDPEPVNPDTPPEQAIPVNAIAASAAASLHIPPPTIHIGPNPANNQWNALAVGLPIWLWTTDPRHVNEQVSREGINITLSATSSQVSFDMGDGSVVTCQSMTPRPPRTDPMTRSPDCGHVYKQPGIYQIRASANWQVAWQALGYSGQEQVTSSGGYRLDMREFSTVVVG